MNKEIIKGNWNEIKGKFKEKWGEISHDDINRIEGSYDQMLAKIQKAYGKTKEEAKNEFNSWYSEQKFSE